MFGTPSEEMSMRLLPPSIKKLSSRETSRCRVREDGRDAVTSVESGDDADSHKN
jgi:hypothetical protein